MAAAVLREYRRRMRTVDQTAPLDLSLLVAPLLVGRTVADIGAGSGLQAAALRAHFGSSEAYRLEGIDAPKLWAVEFSPKAVAALKRKAIYDKVLRASTANLPLPDGSVDTVLSLECLEHLPAAQVPQALAELRRVARRRVIITTPWPEEVTVPTWLGPEMLAAAADKVPLGLSEFRDLAGYVHRSSLDPRSMVAAGFRNPLKLCSATASSAIYIGDPAALRLDRVRVVGSPERAILRQADLRQAYRALLHDSASLAQQAPRSWRYKAVVVLRTLRLALEAWRNLGRLVNG